MKRIHRNGHWNLGGIAIINILTIVKFMPALRVVGQGLYSWYAWSQLSKLKIWDRWFIGMLLILGTRKRQCWDAFNLQIWCVASKHGKYLQSESGPKREKWDFKQPWWDDQELGKILCWWHHPRQYKASEYTHTRFFFQVVCVFNPLQCEAGTFTGWVLKDDFTLGYGACLGLQCWKDLGLCYRDRCCYSIEPWSPEYPLDTQNDIFWSTISSLSPLK